MRSVCLLIVATALAGCTDVPGCGFRWPWEPEQTVTEEVELPPDAGANDGGLDPVSCEELCAALFSEPRPGCEYRTHDGGRSVMCTAKRFCAYR